MSNQSINADEFRSILGRFATGVTILTARDAKGVDHGMTVSSFCSVSLSPPLVLACVARDADMFAVARDAKHFGVSILTDDQEALSRHFADAPDNRFDGISYTRGETGVALLNNVLGQLECRRVSWHEAGDHAICVGEVVSARNGDGHPLLYYRGGYAKLDR
jgi:flavin reductase (DIM6/NTAB) family NADH-FMN oxidoreductase RutF